jgi:hypothetical protein
MQNARLPDTEPFVFAAPVMKAILIGYVKSLVAKGMMNAH